GVVADDHRVGAAQLQGDPLEVLGGGGHGPAAHRGRAGEGDLSDPGGGGRGAVRVVWRPAGVERVKATLGTRGWRTRASPATGPVPVTTLKVPAGRPPSQSSSGRRRAGRGGGSGGLGAHG